MAVIEQVYMHIGQPKTGSSYIQSALANSQDILSANGFVYPVSEATGEKAQGGGITSGNFWPKPGALATLLETANRSNAKKLLISSEAIFPFIKRQGPAFIKELRKHLPDAEVKVFCFLRNPLDHAVSSYQQRVKRGGYTGTFEESLDSFDIVTATIEVLSTLREQDIFPEIHNYSKHRANVLAPVQAWLGLEDAELNRPPKETINRSLSSSELELQRIMNGVLGGFARIFVSDPMCEQLPDIKSDSPPISQEALARFIDRIKAIQQSPEYQNLVPEEERPSIGELSDHTDKFPSPNDSEPVVLSQEQLRVFAESVGRELERVKKLRQQLEKVRERNIRLAQQLDLLSSKQE